LWLLSYYFFNLYKNKANKKLVDIFFKSAFTSSEEIDGKELSELKSKLQKKIHQLKTLSNKLPWYLVIGAPSFGKTSIIKSSGLNFPLEQAVQGLLGEKSVNFEWHLSEDAIFLDISRYQKNELWNSTLNITAWAEIIKILHKYKHGKPINGVIIATDIAVLANTKDKEYNAVEALKQRVQELFQHIGIQIPFYLLITKCDQIKGFTEFFGSYTEKQREQVFGFTFPLQSSTNICDSTEAEYNLMITRLNQQLLNRLDQEHDLSKRELILFFAQQMLLLKDSLLRQVRKFFEHPGFERLVKLRGIYFTSAEQNCVNTFDILGSQIAYQFGLPGLPSVLYAKQNRSYFLTDLFRNIIIPDAQIVTEKRFSQKYWLWIKRVFYSILLLVSAGSVIELSRAYFHEKARILNLDNVVQTAIHNPLLANHKSLETNNILSILDTVRKSLEKEVNNKPWLLSYGIYPLPTLNKNINDFKWYFTEKTFLPYIASRLEKLLENNKDQPNFLFMIYKAYIYLEKPRSLPQSWLKSAILSDWQQDPKINPEQKKELKYYLSYLLSKPIMPSKLNTQLVQETRSYLQNVPLSERIYYSLKDQAKHSNLAAIDLVSALGFEGNKLFSSPSRIIIPAFYTSRGYSKIYSKSILITTKNVVSDYLIVSQRGQENLFSTQAISELLKTVDTLYTNAYISQWENALNSLSIKPFNDLNQAINTTRILRNINSPLISLVNIVNENTNISLNNHDQSISQNFIAFKNLAVKTSPANPSSLDLDSVVKTFTELENYLTKINQSANPSLAVFTAAKTIMQGEAVDPISVLYQQAKQAPKPLDKWLFSIADNSWRIILNNASAEIDKVWINEILPKYQQLEAYFPLNSKSSIEASTSDVVAFFGTGGSLESYFQNYIKPFIKADTAPFEWSSLYNHSIEDSNNKLAVIQALLKSKELYTAKNSQGLPFLLKPLTLSANAASIRLQVGDTLIDYRHGPLQTTSFKWSMSTPIDIRISFVDFNDQRHVKVFSGPWSLLKFINSCSLKPSRQPDHYLLAVKIDNYTASFDLYMENAKSLLGATSK
jgi:type VI secretion system protein ImpL